MSNSSHPFDYLETLEQSASLYSAQIPVEQTDLSYWQGVSFVLDGQHYMVQVGSISEILPVPQTTPLPGVQRWVRGLANVRGRLIPVVSLGDFLKSHQASYVSSQPNHNNRILVIEKKDISVGLIVDEVKGMQQFTVGSHTDEIPATIPENIHPFTQGSYVKDQHYVVFSVEGLVTNERFLKAASE
ncbi:chemotaxis protein CheW [Endozoicomonas sp. GU-1]|uniref:chemotaxis protein CheW n=1 Tax=Endozoicomonas sp. GU-1 TaxID=3009078 RepID=UPI0022B55A73|nr:chemotaxis protein CheW [Endozoicomonas sp. GU-1]WBA81192.1 chemotaxis protein CheW [Endozoicomonas sp. GU-1]WBA84141.1 chemotaxis protein CheW [Endozoicomonas sp. GU-1]